MDIFETFIDIEELKRAMVVTVVTMFAIFFAGMLDLRTGIAASKAKGLKIHSGGLRKTLKKVLEYYTMLIFGVLFDTILSLLNWYELPYGTALIGLICVCIEFYSSIENYKEKRSNAAKIADVIEKIVSAKTKEDALSAIVDTIRISQETKKEDKNEGKVYGP